MTITITKNELIKTLIWMKQNGSIDTMEGVMRLLRASDYLDEHDNLVTTNLSDRLVRNIIFASSHVDDETIETNVHKVKCVKRVKFTKNPVTDSRVILSKNVINNYFASCAEEIDGVSKEEFISSIKRNEDGSSTVYIADEGYKKFFECITPEGIKAMDEFYNDMKSGNISVIPELVKLFEGFACLCDYSYSY